MSLAQDTPDACSTTESTNAQQDPPSRDATSDPATSLFDAAVAASRLLFGEKVSGNGLDDPSIVRRFSSEAPLDYNIFAPFIGTQVPPLEGVDAEVAAITSETVDDHREDVAKWFCDHVHNKAISISQVRSGATMLLYGVLVGDLALVQTMLELGANVQNNTFLRATVTRPHTMRHGLMLVLVAAAVGRLNILRQLCLFSGASPVCHDRWGRTPLHVAAAMLHQDVLQWLTENSELGRSTCDRDSRRALDYLPANAPKEIRALLTSVEVPRCNTSSVKGEKNSLLHWCHCRSLTQPCSCPDAFFERWYMDRANASWLPADVITAMNAVHKKGIYSSGSNTTGSNNNPNGNQNAQGTNQTVSKVSEK